jgi:hypothetical protein
MNGGYGAPPRRQTSVWVYIAMGCGALVVIAVGSIAALGFMGYRWAKKMEADLKDPATRAAKVNEVLGADRLPDGYHPMVSVSVPFVMDMAILSDHPPDAQGQPGKIRQRAFMYFQMLNPQYSEQQMRPYFEGKTSDPSALERSGIKLRIRSDEVLRRGVFTSKGYEVMYLAQRGEVAVSQAESEGINTLMLVDCPQDTRMRMAIWVAPDPDPEAKADSPALVGTPADEGAVRAFMEHFRLCPR